MIVLAIVASIFAFGIPSIKTKQSAMKKTLRDLSLLGREIRNQARLKNMTHRLVFKMEGNQHSYWVEAAQGAVFSKNQEDLKAEERKKEDEKSNNPFQKTTKFFKEDRTLPPKFFIGSVETESADEPLTSGTAYVYFTPEGLVEKSIVQITDKDKIIWSIVYSPLTGHADLMDKAVRLKELKLEWARTLALL